MTNKHLLIDAYECSSNIKAMQPLWHFVTELVTAAGSCKVGCISLSHHDEGLFGEVALETGFILVLTFPEKKLVLADVSCAALEAKPVLDTLQAYSGCGRTDIHEIVRGGARGEEES